jgi:hypothetical protein
MKSNKFLNLKLSDIAVNQAIQVDRGAVRVRVDHSDQSTEKNLIEIARTLPLAKHVLTSLANQGYYVARSRKGSSDLVSIDTLSRLRRLRGLAGPIRQHRELFYTLTPAVTASAYSRLLVLFSSVADSAYTAELSRRNFFQNFPTVQRYLPANTAILRISDIGGVVGSFYLNSKHSSAVEESVQELIGMIAAEVGAEKDSIVLYGASKGGSGALYHGTLGGYQTVAVDPIIAEEYYKVRGDQHFTTETFERPKEEIFKELFDRITPKSVTIITAPRSPQYKHIQQIAIKHPNCWNVSFFESCHPSIKTHPDVGPNTVNALTMLINGYFYGLLPGKKRFQRDLCGGDQCSEICLGSALTH